MALTEAQRVDLYHGFRDVFGPERAEILMGAIPLHDLDEVATKADLATLRADLRADMAELRSEFVTEIGRLRTSMTTWMLTVLVAVIGAMFGVSYLT